VLAVRNALAAVEARGADLRSVPDAQRCSSGRNEGRRTQPRNLRPRPGRARDHGTPHAGDELKRIYPSCSEELVIYRIKRMRLWQRYEKYAAQQVGEVPDRHGRRGRLT
jgi:hypothetical protein